MNTIPTQFDFKAAQDGKSITFTATQLGRKPVSLVFPIEDIGGLVAAFLGSARTCAQLSKSTAQPFAAAIGQSGLAFAQANAAAIQEMPDTPELVALCFAFGDVALAIGLDRTALQPLGTALMATSADSSKPQ